MTVKVEIKGIERVERTGMSLFHGEGDAVVGTEIHFVVADGSGMFYAGKNEGVAIPGKEYCFWFACEPGKALALLQDAVETVNYKDVVVSLVWRIDVNNAKRIMAGYKTRIAELEILACEQYASEEEASEDIEVFLRYNPWMIRGALEVTEDVSFSAPELVPSSDEILNLTQHNATPEQIDEIIDTAESLSQAVIAWHLERGGSMSDTTNPVSFSKSQEQVLARHKERMESQQVIGEDTDYSFLSSPNFDIQKEEQ